MLECGLEFLCFQILLLIMYIKYFKIKWDLFIMKIIQLHRGFKFTHVNLQVYHKNYCKLSMGMSLIKNKPQVGALHIKYLILVFYCYYVVTWLK